MEPVSGKKGLTHHEAMIALMVRRNLSTTLRHSLREFTEPQCCTTRRC